MPTMQNIRIDFPCKNVMLLSIYDVSDAVKATVAHTIVCATSFQSNQEALGIILTPEVFRRSRGKGIG